MKSMPIVLTLLLLLLLHCQQAFAIGEVLTTAEVNDLVTDQTMTVTEIQPDKKTGKKFTLTAYFSELGGVRALHPDGSSQNFNWSVNKYGRLCVLNSVRWGKGICGYMVTDGGSSYKLYRDRANKHKPAMREGRAAPTSRWIHALTFSDLQSGEHLQSK